MSLHFLRLVGRGLPAAMFYLLVPALGLAQMQSGDQMKDFAKVFGVPVKASSYDVVLLEDKTSESSILVPGQQPLLSFLVTNNTANPIKTMGRVDVIHYGTRGITGNVWLPETFKIKDLTPVPIAVDLPANGSQVVEVQTKLPETFGAYAFVFDLGDQGRRFGSSVVRTFAPTPNRIQFPTLSLDKTTGVPVLKSLGIQAVRMEVAYIPTDAKDYTQRMDKLGEQLKELNDNKITALLALYAGQSGEQPLGRPRPFLDDKNFMLPDNGGDMACLPKVDPDFQKFVADVTTRYGWPNGPVTAVALWNEPWDGASISGWGADIPRYRDLYTSMAKGVEQARATGAQVLITGCDSSSNSWDKLFPDGKDDFLKWFDACTIHYQGLWSPSLYRKWRDRTGPYGRVKIWDTESWVANTEDRVATVISGDRAAGYDRAMGVFSGNVSNHVTAQVKMPDGTKKAIDTYFPWSTATAVGAAQHFLGQREFRELLFQNGLPWVMVFNGENNNAEDGTVVVSGDLREAFNPDALMFRNVKGLAALKQGDERAALAQQIAALPPTARHERADLESKLQGLDVLSGGSMAFADPAGEFVLYDFYGNVVPPKQQGMISIPLDSHGYYLRGNGKPGAFDRMLKALAGARIEGYEPLDIAAHDFLAPVDQKPALRLTLTNILNRSIKGSVEVRVAGLKLDAPAQLEMKPHETRDLLIPATEGTPNPENTYPLAFKFDAGPDGAAVLQEDLHVNVIAKRTIKVDGDLLDWKNVLPIPVHAEQGEGPSLALSAWLPFEKFDVSQKPGVATGYLAYDDKNFYFAAKVADKTPSPGTIRFATRKDDDYFYPDEVYSMDRATILWKKEITWKEPSRVSAALLLPGSATQRSYTAWVPNYDGSPAAFAIDFDLPKDVFHQVSFYFMDWDIKPDQNGRTTGHRAVRIEAIDLTTGKSLAVNPVSRYGEGCYATYRLAGKVRLVFRAASTMGGSLSGFFFDPLPATDTHRPNPKDAAAAQFVALEATTGGAWPGKYGSEGYAIFGSEPKYPAYAQVSVPEMHEKTTYHWPEGVRHYSYRKNPDMPFGSYPNFDNIQIAFNILPEDQKEDLLPNLPGVQKGFIPYRDTDYEYALNKVADAFGGGTEIWRSRVPGMPPKHFYPRQPASPFDGAVTNGQLVVKQDDTTRLVEAAIPWSEIPLVKKALDENKPIKFSFRVNDNDGPSMELAQKRSVSKMNNYTFHPDFVPHWANEVEFSFEK